MLAAVTVRWVIRIYRQCDVRSEKNRQKGHRLVPHGMTNSDPK